MLKKELTETDKMLEDLAKELDTTVDHKKQTFKDIFRIDEDELLDMMENENNVHGNDSLEEEFKDNQPEESKETFKFDNQKSPRQ